MGKIDIRKLQITHINYKLRTLMYLDSFPFITATRLFISGPVVVSPSESINFKAVIPSIHSQSRAKWIMTKNKTSTEINFDKVGHSVINSRGPTNTQAVKIPSDLENIGAYQLCLEDAQNNMIKSNMINVFAYGIDSYFLIVTLDHFFIVKQEYYTCSASARIS